MGWGTGLVVGFALLAAACSSDNRATEPNERDGSAAVERERALPDPVKVTGPVTGGAALANAALQDLDAAGYLEEEYFFEGDASSYTPAGELGSNGRWDVAVVDSQPYRTRMIVRRPADADDASGVVVVEWLNVSAGRDGDPDWGYLHQELIREGDTWVGVSVQQVGVSGGEALLEGVALEGGLAGSDPDRYGTLEHPGDAYAYDIFSQAGAAVVNPDGPDPLGGIEITELIAAGESQSAIFMTTYVNAIQPLSGVFDSFLIHSRGGGAAPVNGPLDVEEGLGDGVKIRTDTDVPVLIFETETDLTELDYVSARQDDTRSVSTWEVAGTAHADRFLLEDVYGLSGEADLSAILDCPAPINDGPQHEVIQAGFHHLVAWTAGGNPPPTSPRLEVTGGDEPAIVRDELGIALGGIRTPPVEVPVAVLSGDAVLGGSPFCFLFGSTTPLSAEVLDELYPSKLDYTQDYAAAASDTVAAGFLLEVDAEAMIASADDDYPG